MGPLIPLVALAIIIEACNKKRGLPDLSESPEGGEDDVIYIDDDVADDDVVADDAVGDDDTAADDDVAADDDTEATVPHGVNYEFLQPIYAGSHCDILDLEPIDNGKFAGFCKRPLNRLFVGFIDPEAPTEFQGAFNGARIGNATADGGAIEAAQLQVMDDGWVAVPGEIVYEGADPEYEPNPFTIAWMSGSDDSPNYWLDELASPRYNLLDNPSRITDEDGDTADDVILRDVKGAVPCRDRTCLPVTRTFTRPPGSPMVPDISTAIISFERYASGELDATTARLERELPDVTPLAARALADGRVALLSRNGDGTEFLHTISFPDGAETASLDGIVELPFNARLPLPEFEVTSDGYAVMADDKEVDAELHIVSMTTAGEVGTVAVSDGGATASNVALWGDDYAYVTYNVSHMREQGLKVFSIVHRDNPWQVCQIDLAAEQFGAMFVHQPTGTAYIAAGSAEAGFSTIIAVNPNEYESEDGEVCW